MRDPDRYPYGHTLTWRIVAGLQWGLSDRAPSDTRQVRAVRSALIADMILLKRMLAREADLDRPISPGWLRSHPATDDFLLWLDSPAGAVAKVLARRNIGLILDEYLGFLYGLD